MICTFTKALEDKDQLNYNITVPKYVVAHLVDYFFFNTDGKPYFDGTGQFEGIDGVPTEVNQLLKTFLKVEMDEHDWRDLVTAVAGRNND